jgi:acyl carrier protein
VETVESSGQDRRLRQKPELPRLPSHSWLSARSFVRPRMSATFNSVADIINEVCSIDRAKITPESHTIDDLGIDSLDFLDVTFAIDKRFGIKMPVERWMQEINEGKSKVDDYFVLKNLCLRIDELIAAKPA